MFPVIPILCGIKVRK